MFRVTIFEIQAIEWFLNGRFLVALKEIQVSERIMSTVGLLKSSIDILDEDIRPVVPDKSFWLDIDCELKFIDSDLDECMLDTEGIEVVTFITGYITKNIIEKIEFIFAKYYRQGISYNN